MEVESNNPTQTFNVKDLKDLKRDISSLDKTEQLEILKIIKASGNKLTENKNGIFINLSYVSKESLLEIQKFVHYSIENKSRLENLERLSEELFKESMLKKGYDNYTPNTENVKDGANVNVPVKSDEEDDNEDVADENVNDIHLEEEIEITNAEMADQDEDNNLVVMKVNKDILNNEDDDEEEEEDEGIDRDEEEDKINDINAFSLIKKNRFTGRKARLVKKCKEITRNSQSELSYFGYHADTTKGDDDNGSEADDEIDIGPSELGNELVEEV